MTYSEPETDLYAMVFDFVNSKDETIVVASSL